MADISDVLSAIASNIGSSIYPNGTAQASSTGISTMIYPGWPTPAQLDKDLKVGKAHVSVYPLPVEKMESVINQDAQTVSIATPGTTISINGLQVTIGGVPAVGDVACLSVNKTPEAYAVQANDTTDTIAAALAALVGGTATGSVITLAQGTFLVSATVSTSGSTMTSIRRISRNVQIRTWAPSPSGRDTTAKAVYTALWNAERLTMPDGTLCGLTYGSDRSDDSKQKSRLYTRDLILSARFIETLVASAQTVANLQSGISTPAVSAVEFNIGA